MLRVLAGKRLSSLSVLVPIRRGDRELHLTDDETKLLMGMSAATIDRRLAPGPGQAVPCGWWAPSQDAVEVGDLDPHLAE